ncbi:hypothetical protein FQA39_LY00001 [Lamprigera yunnana]|nr:hypothetical protein FQA39_LY00001 [Lamprigera yunnana]
MPEMNTKISRRSNRSRRPPLKLRDDAHSATPNRTTTDAENTETHKSTEEARRRSNCPCHIPAQYQQTGAPQAQEAPDQKVLDQSSDDDELSIQNMSKTEDITEDVKILYHWEYFEGLSSPMMSTIATAASDLMRNGCNFINTITLRRDCRACMFNRYDAEAIFQLKSLINYRLELIRSSGLEEFYDNMVECVIIQKSKREEIRRMVGINVDDLQVYDDGGAYEIFEQIIKLIQMQSFTDDIKSRAKKKKAASNSALYEIYNDITPLKEKVSNVMGIPIYKYLFHCSHMFKLRGPMMESSNVNSEAAINNITADKDSSDEIQPQQEAEALATFVRGEQDLYAGSDEEPFIESDSEYDPESGSESEGSLSFLEEEIIENSYNEIEEQISNENLDKANNNNYNIQDVRITWGVNDFPSKMLKRIYNSWKNKNLEEALNKLGNGTTGFNEAWKYKIPKPTLSFIFKI